MTFLEVITQPYVLLAISSGIIIAIILILHLLENPFTRLKENLQEKMLFWKEKKAQQVPLQKSSPAIVPGQALASEIKRPMDQEVDLLISTHGNSLASTMFELDKLTRAFIAKKYKLNKKVSYVQMQEQLMVMKEAEASNFIAKIIEYAYSGHPLDEQKMNALLMTFRALVSEEELLHPPKIQKIPVQQAPVQPVQPAIAPTVPAPQQPSQFKFSMPAMNLKPYKDKIEQLSLRLKSMHMPEVHPQQYLTKAMQPMKRWQHQRTMEKEARLRAQSGIHIIESRSMPLSKKIPLRELNLEEPYNAFNLAESSMPQPVVVKPERYAPMPAPAPAPTPQKEKIQAEPVQKVQPVPSPPAEQTPANDFDNLSRISSLSQKRGALV